MTFNIAVSILILQSYLAAAEQIAALVIEKQCEPWRKSRIETMIASIANARLAAVSAMDDKMDAHE
jgi:hypothetical protein